MSDDKKLKCDPEQLELLLKCSKEEDIKPWNKWREKNPDEEIWLEGAGLFLTHLKGANLNKAHLQEANMLGAKLQDAYIVNTHLEKASLIQANLKRAHFQSTHLEKAQLDHANLEGAMIIDTHLQGTVFHSAIVNSKTHVWYNKFNEKTDFTGVALDNCRIDPRLKASLKTIIRRNQWEGWYKENRWLKRPIQAFWLLTDYGNSTGRILVWFSGFAFSFGLIYWKFNHLVCGLKGNSFPFLRSMYFSVVTMTTLGFGDMYAAKDSYIGHILLMIQVILGYVLLGALITRFGILFTQEGPAYPIPPVKPGIFSRIFTRLSKIISKLRNSPPE